MTPEIASLIERHAQLQTELKIAENTLKLALNNHHGLIGKIALNYGGKPFIVDRIDYMWADWKLFKISGRLIRKDGTLSQHRADAYPPFKFQEPST